MTSCYFMGESALRSSSASRPSWRWRAKAGASRASSTPTFPTRRTRGASSWIWRRFKTYAEKGENVHDIFENHGKPLLHLHVLALPINMKFGPVEHLREMPAESAERLFNAMPRRARDYVKWCDETST
eukprot:775470-Pyramimonas_sp.AAC.1